MERNLILSRKIRQKDKPGETVTIEGPAVVEVVKVKGNRVTLAIRAEECVKILRTEIVRAA